MGLIDTLPRSNGSDIVVISKDSMNKGSDGLSNNSSEMKVEVRTSSSLSNGEDCWEGTYIFKKNLFWDYDT